ncbi:hypothetical protein Tco_1252609 [Tanacetum coccineum]
MPTTTTTVTETTTTTTTTTVLPPPQPQHDVSTSILIQTIGQLEQKIADLVDANQALEKRIDKQGNRIHQLESQDLSRLIREQTVEFIDSQEIDRKIEESVKEVVTASVQHENYDKGHEDHKMAYEALQKSIIHDESEKFDADKAEERTKKKSKQNSPKTPPGSPPTPPPPPPLPGVSGASGITGASDFAQDPPPPPPSLTTNRGDQSHSSAALGSSKTAASTAYIAETTTHQNSHPLLHLFLKTYLCIKSQTLKLRIWGLTMKIAAVGTFPKSPEPPTAQRQEDSLYCRQLMDKKFGYQKKVERLPCSHREPVSETRVNKVNPGLNTRFWTKNDVIKSKQFMFAIPKRLKLRRIFWNLEIFVGGRILEGDYRLL